MPEIVHEKWKCIGCYACESAAPEFFKMKDENGSMKAQLLKATQTKVKEGILETKKITAEEVKKAKEAESVCPVSCIHVKQ